MIRSLRVLIASKRSSRQSPCSRQPSPRSPSPSCWRSRLCQLPRRAIRRRARRRPPPYRGPERRRVKRGADAPQKQSEQATSALDRRTRAPSPNDSEPIIALPVREADSASLRRRAGGAVTCRRPGYDVSSRNQIVDETDGLRHRRLVEELDHQRQIDCEPQHIIRVNLSIGAKLPDALWRAFRPASC